MAKDRASIFDSGDTALLDVSSFNPKPAANVADWTRTCCVAYGHAAAMAQQQGANTGDDDPGPAGRLLVAWRGLDRSAPLSDDAVFHVCRTDRHAQWRENRLADQSAR
jgi:hypothetical protein